jgi:hypothetical protein
MIATRSTPSQKQSTAVIKNSTERLQTIGALSVGISETITFQPEQAKIFNTKIGQLAETPTPEQVTEVLASIKDKRIKADLDKQITKQIEEKRQLAAEAQTLINNLTNTNAALQQEANATKDELSKMKSPTYAIWYGIKTLVKRFLYSLVGLTILFFILRTFAASSPIIGAIFSIFEQIVAFIIKGVGHLFPKALTFAGNVPVSQNHALSVIIDSIETQKIAKPDSMTELLQTIQSAADAADKEAIAQVKKQLGY